MANRTRAKKSISIQVSHPIDALPTQVYDLLSDVTRMPEWSPELVSARWLGSDHTARTGARFEGTNKITTQGRKPLEWKTKPRITEVVPGRVFAFRVPRPSNSVWRYELHATASGTLVTARMDCPGLPAVLRLLQRRAGITDRASHLRRDMETTLAALAETLGSEPNSNPVHQSSNAKD